jgi:hypothetical protein
VYLGSVALIECCRPLRQITKGTVSHSQGRSFKGYDNLFRI